MSHGLSLTTFINSHVDGRTSVWKCLVHRKQKAEETFPDREKMGCCPKSFRDALDCPFCWKSASWRNAVFFSFFVLPVLLMWNSGEVYAPSLIAFLGSHQGHPVVLLQDQCPECIQTTLNWRVPLCLRCLVCGFGSRWPWWGRYLFFRDHHHRVFCFL